MQNLTRKIAEYTGLGALALGLCGGCVTMVKNRACNTPDSQMLGRINGEYIKFQFIEDNIFDTEGSRLNLRLENVTTNYTSSSHQYLKQGKECMDYLIESYDTEGKLLYRHPVIRVANDSAIEMYYDTFNPDDPGGMIKIGAATLTGCVPCDNQMEEIRITTKKQMLFKIRRKDLANP